MRKNTESAFTIFVLILSLLSIGWNEWFWSKPYYNTTGLDESGKIVYAGKVPLDTTYAYNQFKMSSRSELAKLYYLLDRLNELNDFQFRFGGSYFDKEMTRFGMDWVFTHRYKKKQDAREFLRQQVAWLEGAGDRLLIRFPDGKLYHCLPILFNELDLLEVTYKQEKTVHFLRPAEKNNKSALDARMKK